MPEQPEHPDLTNPETWKQLRWLKPETREPGLFDGGLRTRAHDFGVPIMSVAEEEKPRPKPLGPADHKTPMPSKAMLPENPPWRIRNATSPPAWLAPTMAMFASIGCFDMR